MKFVFSDFRFFFIRSSFPPFFHMYLYIYSLYLISLSFFHVPCFRSTVPIASLMPQGSYFLLFIYLLLSIYETVICSSPQVLAEAYLLIPAHSGHSRTCKVLPRPFFFLISTLFMITKMMASRLCSSK
jgi:hypothetical protein